MLLVQFYMNQIYAVKICLNETKIDYKTSIKGFPLKGVSTCLIEK